MSRNAQQYEPGADVRFGLAYERLAAEDVARSAWLAQHWNDPERSEVERHPEDKTEPPAKGRCKRWGCHAKVRCKGLCARHYFTAKSRERRAG